MEIFSYVKTTKLRPDIAFLRYFKSTIHFRSTVMHVCVDSIRLIYLGLCFSFFIFVFLLLHFAVCVAVLFCFLINSDILLRIGHTCEPLPRSHSFADRWRDWKI